MPSTLPLILLIGQDVTLTYLIERYAERSGYVVHTASIMPALSVARDLQSTAVLFASIENFEAAQALPGDLTSCEVPLLVCVSVNDQARAHELGADYCLVHPLTYDSFLAVVTAISAPSVARGRTDRRGSARASM